MDPDDFIGRFFTELKSYAPVVLPTLLIYAIESSASLKLWHAVQQIPHLEKEVSPDDSESNIDAARRAEIIAARAAVTKEARRVRIGLFCVGLILLAISLFEQYVALNGMLDRSRDEDELEDYTFGDLDESGLETENMYGRYYNSTFGQIDWAKSYYVITLFWPAVFLIARASYLLSGLKDRAVLRDCKGMPFMVSVTNGHFKMRYPALVAVAIILASILLAAGALLFRSSICAAILYTSLIHFMVSNATPPKDMTFKRHVIGSFIVLAMLAFLLFNLLSSVEEPRPFRFFYFAPHVFDTNWSALIFSSLVAIGPFNFISLCYRVDHAFARPDELLVGSPDVKIAHNAAEVYGTRLSYAFSRFTASSASRPRFEKPYFHAAVWGWLTVYAMVAALSVAGYIECKAESAGLYALYVAPPLMGTVVLLRALLRGEVKRLWLYKEEWKRNPADMQAMQGGLVLEGNCNIEAKSFSPDVSEKVVPQA